jgi:Family of unknown function (DUF6252)
MKPFIKTTLLLAFSFLLISGSCKKEKTGTDGLPAATQEGKNTFGCVINGKAFIAQSRPFNPAPPITCRYDYIDYSVSKDHKFYVIGSDNKSDYSKIISIKIFTNKIDIQEGTTYQFQSQKDSGAYAEHEIIAGNITTSTSTTGELTITKFDEVNKIASGTFWFDADNDKGEKVEVRDGRFDAKIL